MITDRDKFEAWFSKKHNLLDEDLKSHRSGYFTYITYQGKAKSYLEHDWEVWSTACGARK